MHSYYTIMLITIITTFYNFTETDSRRWIKTERSQKETKKTTHVKNVDSLSNEGQEPKIDSAKSKRKWWPVLDPHGNKYYRFTKEHDINLKGQEKEMEDPNELSQKQIKEQEQIIEQIKKDIPKMVHALATPNVDYANFWSAVTRPIGTPCTSASNLQQLNNNLQNIGIQHINKGRDPEASMSQNMPLVYQGNNNARNKLASSNGNGVLYPELEAQANALTENQQEKSPQSQQEHPLGADETAMDGDEQPMGPLSSDESLMLLNILKAMDAQQQYPTPKVLDTSPPMPSSPRENLLMAQVQSNSKFDYPMQEYAASPASSNDQVQSNKYADYPLQDYGASPASSYYNQPMPYSPDHQQDQFGGPSPCTEHSMAAESDYNLQNYQAGIPNGNNDGSSFRTANKLSNKDYETFEDAWHNFANAYRQYRVQNYAAKPKKRVFGFKREGPCDPEYSHCDNRKKAYYYTDFKSKAQMRKALGSILSKDYRTFAKTNVWFIKNTVRNVGEAFMRGIKILTGTG